MNVQQILNRIEYKPECHHCYTEDEVIKAMKKYAKQKCREQRELFEEFVEKDSNKKIEIPEPFFD